MNTNKELIAALINETYIMVKRKYCLDYLIDIYTSTLPKIGVDYIEYPFKNITL